MAFMMMKKKKYKFNVECCLEKLVDVPFVAGVLFAKARLLDGGSYQQYSNRIEVSNHTVVWNTQMSFECKMTANASNGVLETCNLRISVRKECKGGRSYQKLGFVDINLAELAGAGEMAHCYLLEGYDTRRRQDNSTIKLRIRMNMLSGDPLFKVPSSSLKHKQLSEHLGVVDAVLPESEVVTGNNGNPPTGGTPEQQQPPIPPVAPANQADNRDDCGSSIASGSSGFGSLPKKRPALVSSEFLNNQNNLVSSESEGAENDLVLLRNSANDNIPVIRGEETEAGTVATLQRQRSGSDMLERCVLSAVSTHCPNCLQGNTHSRNSSNTSGEMSSKISGYGSSLSQQSQHSRQSSEGGDSSEGGRHQPGITSTLIRRFPPKLYIDRNRQIKASSPGCVNASDNSDAYLTPNSTLSDISPQADLPIRSADTPLSPVDETIFHTPNSTMLSPIPADENSNRHLPSYFDRKKQDIISLAKSAAHVLPLHNFQLFKQKSLNTIPDLIERRSAKEQRESESELFHNFPFLTPLAHRKNSIHDKSRLSSCNEDDFYLTPEYDVDGRFPLRSAGFCEGKTFANLIYQPHGKIECLPLSIAHSTPKCDQVNCGKMAPKKDKANLENPFNSVNPLRHSYTTHCVPADARPPNNAKMEPQDKPTRDTWCRQCGAGAAQQQECDSLPPTLKHRRPSTAGLNNSGGLMTETGSLDRGKAALERRKPKTVGPYGTIGGTTTGSDPEPQTGHLVSGRVENTRVNPDSLIDELLKSTNLEQVEDNAETSGLQLFIAQDGTTALGSRQIKSQMTQGRRAYKQVVMEARDNR